MPGIQVTMSNDQVIEILELIEEDSSWLPELYSIVANSELIMPMVLRPGFADPAPMATTLYPKEYLTLNPEYNDYEPCVPVAGGIINCLVYSNRDIYNSLKQALDEKYKRFGIILDPLILNGRQIINICLRWKQCAAINYYAAGVPKYQLSFEEMRIIQRTPVVARPNAEPPKKDPPNLAHGDTPQKSFSALEKKMKSGVQQLQASLKDVLKDRAKLKAELEYRDKLINDLQANLKTAWDHKLPTSVLEAIEDASRRFGSRLAFHPRVKDNVEAWPQNKNTRCVAQAVSMFEALAQILYQMKFAPDGYVNPKLFQDITGIPLAMTEGKVTKRTKRLDVIRTCEYEGQTISFYPHLKASVNKIQMRVYFGFLEESQKILICHVGEHLPNSQTKDL